MKSFLGVEPTSSLYVGPVLRFPKSLSAVRADLVWLSSPGFRHSRPSLAGGTRCTSITGGQTRGMTAVNSHSDDGGGGMESFDFDYFHVVPSDSQQSLTRGIPGWSTWPSKPADPSQQALCVPPTLAGSDPSGWSVCQSVTRVKSHKTYSRHVRHRPRPIFDLLETARSCFKRSPVHCLQ
ncbi:hypothetical protein RRG08_056125 [Elysia crispata]|uniref:Uncharacterized protein n=1 Tax=Elysia crispata TaxID=231223 RepID=A0AAE1D553_9GAST|nr:hypothetical protein RRG08_056125 [Elysia crispata]